MKLFHEKLTRVAPIAGLAVFSLTFLVCFRQFSGAAPSAHVLFCALVAASSLGACAAVAVLWLLGKRLSELPFGLRSFHRVDSLSHSASSRLSSNAGEQG
jgi:hypothetical protein